MSDVALNANNRDGTITAPQTSAPAVTETSTETISLREHLLRGAFLLAAVIATGGWLWLLAWIGLSLLGY
jgi:hypothetical protein